MVDATNREVIDQLRAIANEHQRKADFLRLTANRFEGLLPPDDLPEPSRASHMS